MGAGEAGDRSACARTAWRARTRYFEVFAACTSATLDTLTPLVYDDVPVDRHAWARLTLQAHLIKLVREARLLERNGTWRPPQT